MPDFSELFATSKGKPIEYNGRTLQMWDRFPVKNGQTIRVAFECANSDWLQGIGLKVDGGLTERSKDWGRGLAIWEKSSPNGCDLKVRTSCGHVEVKNLWDRGDGFVDFWNMGGAMIVESIPRGRRYLCNDGYPDDDFDDLIFTIVVLDDQAS